MSGIASNIFKLVSKSQLYLTEKDKTSYVEEKFGRIIDETGLETGISATKCWKKTKTKTAAINM